MSTFISPDGNPEIWEEKPDNYFTPEEWAAAHPILPPTPEEIQRHMMAAIQARLDEFFQKRGYDNVFTAKTYALSSNPTYKIEGDYAVWACDETWGTANKILADVKDGKRPMPTEEEVMAELPPLAWPNEDSHRDVEV